MTYRRIVTNTETVQGDISEKWFLTKIDLHFSKTKRIATTRMKKTNLYWGGSTETKDHNKTNTGFTDSNPLFIHAGRSVMFHNLHSKVQKGTTLDTGINASRLLWPDLQNNMYCAQRGQCGGVGLVWGVLLDLEEQRHGPSWSRAVSLSRL